RSVDDCSTLVTCTSGGARYCGKIGNGCGGVLDCADCPNGEVCGANGIDHLCGVPSDGCAPLTCAQGSGHYCGSIGDGCGRELVCGDCAAPFTCGGGGIANVCGAAVDSGACSPTTCEQASGRYCGTVGNNCGGQIDCGTCTGPNETCGGAGLDHV